MPTSAPRVCGQCGGVHPAGERCPKAVARHKERKAVSDKKRPSARARGYTKEWERESKRYLAAYPSCVRCGQPANLVHHAVPHRGNRSIFWDRSLWRSYCTPCHSGPAQSAERRNT